MALKRIPDRDLNIICASINVNKFLRAVEELVYNSLDAESTSIAVRVCIEKKYIQVLDNGKGIAKDNFRLLGEKYVTNKFLDAVSLKTRPNNYGYKGITLASIIEISETVHISSRYQNSQETWTKIFCKGSTEGFNLTTLRPSKGTTVEITGFLYNLIIQKKSIDALSEINSIKMFLEQLSLVHCNVSLSLRDDSKNEIIFKVHKNRDIYQTLWTLYQIKRSDLQDLQVEKNEYKVKALISKNNDVSKKYQYVYINGRNISKSFLHKQINECLTKKLCIRTNKKMKEKFTDEIYFKCKIPFYFIFISCPHCEFDINYNNKQTLVDFKNCEEINKLIEKLINFYCGDNNLKQININEVNDKNEHDKRTKVKEIMERILNKNVLKENIMELQKAKKGKNIQRKDKKINQLQKPDKELEKYRRKNKLINISTNKTKINKTVETKKHNNKKVRNNRKLEIIYSSINKKNKSIKSNNRTKTTHKFKNNNEPLLRKFKEETKSIKKRRQKLYNEVQNVFENILLKNGMHEFNTIQNINFGDNNSSDLQYTRKEDWNALNKQINIANNNSVIKLKTSYDLLKTTDNIVEMSQVNIFSKEKNTNIKEICNSYTTTIPDFTYNSHRKNLELYQRSIRNNSDGKSYVNQNILSQIYNDVNQHNRNIILLKKAIFNEYSNRHVSLTKLDHDNDNNILSNRSHTYDTENVNNSPNYKMSCNVNFEFANTYSIDILNSFYSNNQNINKTYSLRMSTNLSYNNDITKTLPSITNTNGNVASTNDNYNEKGKTTFISESQSNGETIEPLVYCEAILNSNEMRDVEQEFDISFLENKKEDVYTVLNVDDYNNVSCEVEQKSQYFCDEKVEANVVTRYFKGNERLLNDLTHQDVSNNEIEDDNLPLENDSSSQKILNKETINKEYFNIHSRHSFVPKGMSQIFKNKLYKSTDAHNINEEYFKEIIYKEFANDIRNKFEIFEPDVQNAKDTLSKEFNKAADVINNDNSNLTFNSESLKHAKIIGQVDRKFIAAILESRSHLEKFTEYLTFFDQHAVDERVRLEKNLSDYFDGVKWKSIEFEEFMLKINSEDYFYLYNYKEKFSQFGLQWTITSKDLILHAVPIAIIGKNPRKLEVVSSAVRKLISEQIEEIKRAGGNTSVYPKSIMELVSSEACRYAVKFGDCLSKNDCIKMISALSTCKTPFQCAHGRPVMAIIMEIFKTNQTYKIRKNGIKKFVKDYLCYK